MKIAIVGAGAIGCYVGGRLAEQRHDVLFLARARSKEELKTFGLTVVARGGVAPFTVGTDAMKVTLDPRDLADRDVVLVCVKSGQTAEVGASLAPHLRANAVVVSMQNGVRNADVLREHITRATVLGGIVGFNVVAKGKGVYHQGTTGILVVEDASPRARPIGNALRAAGFNVKVARDVRALQWSKLVVNLNNAIGALADVSTPTLMFDAGYRRVLAAVMGEAISVLRHAGQRTARLGAIPVQLFPVVLRLPTPLLRVVARAQVKMDPAARSSMWQDLTARRMTEIDELNGEIVRLAERSGTRAPINARVVELIRDAEARSAGPPGLSADALWSALHER